MVVQYSGSANSYSVLSFMANRHPIELMGYISSSFFQILCAGFLPVWLQGGIELRLLPVRKGVNARSAFTHSLPAYTSPKVLGQKGAFPQPCWSTRSRAKAQAILPLLSITALQPRDSWLPSGLCYGIGSSLSMAYPKLSTLPIDSCLITTDPCSTSLYALA